MPSTQLYNKGSDNSVFSHPVYTNVKRSRFDLSKKKFFTADVGMIMPVDLIPTLPGDDFEISCSYILETLPLVAPSMTNYRVRTHWYYIDNISLWKGWSTFITKGRSGSIELSVPSTRSPTALYLYPLGDYYGYLDILDFDVFYMSPMSLFSFLGLNSRYLTGDPSDIDSSTSRSASVYSQANYLPMAGLGAYLYVNGYSIDSDGNFVDADGDSVSLPGSIPQNFSYPIPNSTNPVSYSLLPFLFYQKIYRQNYLNENLMQDNKIWFPDDITDGWRFNYSASNLFTYPYGNTTNFCLFCPSDSLDYYSGSCVQALDSNTITTTTSDYIVCANSVPKVTDNAVHLFQLRYAMFENDYFTTALPWQQRGTAPTLEGAGSAVWDSDSSIAYDNYSIPATGSFTSTSYNVSEYYGAFGYIANADGQFVLALPHEPGSTSGSSNDTSVQSSTSTSSDSLTAFGSSSSSVVSSMLDNWIAALNNNSVALGINLGDIRSLMALSVWQERNARTNGNYNSTIYAHFEQNPKQTEFEPVYIGGTSDNVQFTRVIQTSESSSSSPLGSEAGLGSLQANGFVGRFHCNDYGFIMGVMIISPEVSYAQSIQHFWTELSQSDYYMPEFSSLSLQPILNFELYPQGTSSTDTSDDSDSGLFGYQERYTYLKQRSNTVSGLFALPSDVDSLFSAYAQERWFDSLPALSQQFVTMSPDNIRRDWLSYPSQPAFKVQFASNIYATRPLPYQNVPATFGF